MAIIPIGLYAIGILYCRFPSILISRHVLPWDVAMSLHANGNCRHPTPILRQSTHNQDQERRVWHTRLQPAAWKHIPQSNLPG